MKDDFSVMIDEKDDLSYIIIKLINDFID